MRGVTRVVLPMCLMAALLAGCSQGTTPEGSAGSAAQGSAAAEAVQEAPQPEMSNWQDKAFYERPVSDIANDLLLLGFEVDEDNSLLDQGDGYSYLYTVFSGTPEDNPFEGASEAVSINLTVEFPEFEDGASEGTYETLAEGTMPNGYDVTLYYADVDSSEYESLARGVADTVGLGEFTESSVGPSPFDETRMLGNFFGNDTFRGSDCEWLITITKSTSDSLPDPEKPLMLGFGHYVTTESIQ